MIKISPYLLGILLSDSSFCNKELIKVTMTNVFIIEMLRHLIEPYMDIKLGGSNSYGTFYNLSFVDGDNELKDILKKFGLLGVKGEDLFIPKEIKDSKEVSTKTAFLLGLFDGNGSMTSVNTKITKGGIKFYTISKTFQKDLEILIKSIGGKTKHEHVNGNWDIDIYLPFPVSLYEENNNVKKVVIDTGMPK